MAVKLTRRKTAWADKRKPDIIRGDPLSNPTSLEMRYIQRLHRLVMHMADEVEFDLKQFFHGETAKEYFAQDESIASQARILMNALMGKFNQQFAEMSKTIAEQQIAAVSKASSSALHGSLQKLTGGFSLKTTTLAGDISEVVTASVAENVGLIKSISQQYLAGVQGAVMRSVTTGRGLADLVPYLEKSREITARRAKFIAHDQTRKAYSSINKARMEKVGLTKGGWLHTGGSSHPRKSHQAFNQQTFELAKGMWDPDAKQYVWPGSLPGCRCRYFTVLEFGDDE